MGKPPMASCITWNNGRLTQAVVRSKLGKPCVMRYGNEHFRFNTQIGQSYVIGYSGNLMFDKNQEP